MLRSELETIEEARLLIEKYETDELRQCEVCNKYMIDGYVYHDSTLCSEECLFSPGYSTPEEWEEIDHENSDDCYWTAWTEFTDEEVGNEK